MSEDGSLSEEDFEDGITRYGMAHIHHDHCEEHGPSWALTFGSGTPVIDLRAALASLPENARVCEIVFDSDDQADVVAVTFVPVPAPVGPVTFSMN